MLRVLTLDQNKKPLMPCHPMRARELLAKGKARVYRLKPFSIILIERDGGAVQATEHKIDPGSKQTGMALVTGGKRGKKVVFALNLQHRGQQIKEALASRRAIRRSRRNRKTRYRPARFDNRRRPEGWLPPSLRSRVQNVISWTAKLIRLAPISSIAVETVRFDTQKLQNPEITGAEYQQGELFGYELREHLLEKWQRQCAYCGAKATALEVEHMVPKSKGGSDRVSNLTLACRACNLQKGSQSLEQFVKDKKKLSQLLSTAKAPLKDAAAVNATRYATGNALKEFKLPISFWSGGRTKHNRVKQGYDKDHWIDAVCVGESGRNVLIPRGFTALKVKAEGRGSRQKCRVDRFGFPRTSAKSQKRIHGFSMGDIVKAVVIKGKKAGTYMGRIAVRATGNFNLKVEKETIQGINYKCCRLIQRADGYSYR